MTTSLLEHRRAKAFAEALAAHQNAGEHQAGDRSGEDAVHGRSAAMAELLATADALAGVPAPELDSEVRAVQRAQLMAAFEQAFAEGTEPGVPEQRRGGAHRATAAVSGAASRLRPRSRWGRRLAVGGLAAAVALGGFAGVSVASTNALPGDALYGMKRSLESWQLDLAGSDSERGSLLLDQASTRLHEAQQLVVRSGSASGSSAILSPTTVEQIRKALDDMHNEGLSGRDLLRSVYRSNGSLAPMRKLADFAQTQDDRWSSLRRRLPAQLAPVASQVTQLLDDMSEDVAPLHIAQHAEPDSGEHGSTPGDDGPDDPGASAGSDRAAKSPSASDNPSTAPQNDGGHSAPGATPTPGSTPAIGTEGLVGGLDGLTGGSPSSSSTGAAGTDAGSSASPGASPRGEPGFTLPPLIPGLLPGLGVNLSN